MKYGVQLFSLRSLLKDEEGYKKAFESVKDMGAEVVQLSGGKPISPETIKKLAEDNALEVCITHDPFERLKNEPEKVAEEHLVYGCKRVGIGMMPKEFRESKDGVMRFVEFLNATSERLKPYDMTVSYHNHWFEFDETDGKRMYDILIDETDERVMFIPDTFWMRVKNAPIEDYLKRLAGRVDTLHVKDYKKTLGLPVFRAVGKGEIDFESVLRVASDTGVKNVVAELDISPNPLKSMRFSMETLKGLKAKIEG